MTRNRAEPERSVLDDACEFVDDHLVASRAQVTAMVLYAAATHAMRQHATIGRMLFTSKMEESGKTLAMEITASLCANPLNTKGTSYALSAALAAATNEPERAVPTLYRDEVSDIFGRAGLNGSTNPIAGILREGYKRGATDAWSVSRVQEVYSIFTPFLMTGLRTAVPRDIRSRSIVITMVPGTPRRYFDVRESEPFAEMLAGALSSAVKGHADEIGAFRGRGLHPRMHNRKLEVWEPLAAVAWALGGSRWLTRCVSAFTELALDESDIPALTPVQMVLKDVAGIAEAHRALTGEEFAGGLMLADELRHIGGPLYAGRTPASLSSLISESVPFASEQRRMGAKRVRGYPVPALVDAWEDVRPAGMGDAEPVAEPDLFADEDLNDAELAELAVAPEVPVTPVPPVTEAGLPVPSVPPVTRRSASPIGDELAEAYQERAARYPLPAYRKGWLTTVRNGVDSGAAG